MSGISTHVLDTTLGRPAARVEVRLDILVGDEWETVATGITDADGRCDELIPAKLVAIGSYRIVFATWDYFNKLGQATLYPEVDIIFQVDRFQGKYHIPLLLSPFGYSTYRGS